MRPPTRPLVDRLVDSGPAQRLLESVPGVDETIDRFIAGPHASDAVAEAADMVSKGLDITFAETTLAARDEQAADAVLANLLEVVTCVHEQGLPPADVTVSLAALGSRLGSSGMTHASARLRHLVEAAHPLECSVMIDAGSTDETDDLLALAEDLRGLAPETGVSLLAGLRRTATDVHQIASDRRRIRLLKGNLPRHEVGSRGFDTEHRVDRNYVAVLRQLMESSAYPVVATHDHRLVSITHELVKRTERTRADYEFQMRMGVRPFEHRRLVDTGRPVRVLVPFGQDWYGYVVHRLADKPQALGRLARKLVFRR